MTAAKRKHLLRSTALLAAAALGVALLIGTVLPWLAANGYAGSVIQANYEHDRDATALFYTESERTWQILDQVDAARDAQEKTIDALSLPRSGNGD